MRHFLRLTDFTPREVFKIFRLADGLGQGRHRGCLEGKTVVLFFPESSLRTRVTFEKGVRLLGGQPILFPPEALDKREKLWDVCGYLAQWADLLIVRHKSLALLEQLAGYSSVPVINAMTAENHPCEILSDLYALSKRREDFRKDSFLFCGARGNIGLAWKEAAGLLGFSLEQCCPRGYEIEGLKAHSRIEEAVIGKDIVCTDSLPAGALPEFAACRVTLEAMRGANPGALLNPCPPFYRGEEVTDEVMDSEFFVGYGFKKHLLEVQQAVMLSCLLPVLEGR